MCRAYCNRVKISTPPVTGIAGTNLGGVRCVANTGARHFLPLWCFPRDESVNRSAWRCAR
jgi:hypothetical protein